MHFKSATLPKFVVGNLAVKLNGVFCSTKRLPTLDRFGGPPHVPVAGTEDLGAGERSGTWLVGPLSDAEKLTFSAAWRNSGYLDSHKGNAGALLGYENGITVAAATTLPFASTLAPIKVSNASTLHVSIPELGGITSFDGGRSDYSRTIGVLTRGQFGTESVAGAQTAVSNFDNWIDCNNAQKVSLNSLTAQVSSAHGPLRAALRPETRLP
jgi:hypothetical protein